MTGVNSTTNNLNDYHFDNFQDKKINLNNLLVNKPEETFLIRIEGQSMVNAGIYDGDLLIIDKARGVKDGDVVLVLIDDIFTVRRFVNTGNQIILKSEHDSFEDIELTGNVKLQLWGVVTFVIHQPNIIKQELLV
jgi:DNA polymerase V